MTTTAKTPDARGRFPVQVPTPYPMTGLSRLVVRNHDVQGGTGAAVSTVPKGQWDRGQIYRTYTPEIRPSGRELFMYDPTQPQAWHQPQR